MYKYELIVHVTILAVKGVTMLAKRTGTARLRARRIKCWIRQGGLCYHCRRPTQLVMVDGRPTDALATLEHLRDRLDPERGKDDGREHTVMACFDCNHKRGIARNRL